jgi:hypothetical protein
VKRDLRIVRHREEETYPAFKPDPTLFDQKVSTLRERALGLIGDTSLWAQLDRRAPGYV